MIELKKVSKKYGGQQALHDIDLIIPKGKIIGLVGENGSGKTTLLKLTAGLLTPDSGKALYGGAT
ncbi:ATP-binding cassette domain-containing protein, partial [Microvirga sp. 3-52]|nr:ATP-binding cassette domain-containing protein [Microvirga sp. 3-52]